MESIETRRVLLREFRVDDAAAMYTNWASDEEVTRFLTWPVHESEEATRTLLEAWQKEYSNPFCFNWAMESKEKGEVIGSISVVERDEKCARMTIGYCLSRALWNKGMMSECLQAVIDFLFENTNVNRIEARHDMRNLASGRVMEKCGMKREGILREYERNNQGISDSQVFSILRTEWNKECCRF